MARKKIPFDALLDQRDRYREKRRFPSGPSEAFSARRALARSLARSFVWSFARLLAVDAAHRRPLLSIPYFALQPWDGREERAILKPS